MTSAKYNVLFVCVCVGLVSSVDSFCPGPTSNGTWREDIFERHCILKCDYGYAPSGCCVIRPKGELWNHDVPTCQEMSVLLRKSVLLVFGTGLVAVAAMPGFFLSTIGFTIAGVSAVSTAAGRQMYQSGCGMS